MSDDAAQHGPAARRTGIPRDLPDQEAAPDAETGEESEGEVAEGGEDLPDTDETGSGPRRAGGADGSGGRHADGTEGGPPEPVESTD